MLVFQDLPFLFVPNKRPYSEFFWYLFSHIQTEYGENDSTPVKLERLNPGAYLVALLVDININ